MSIEKFNPRIYGEAVPYTQVNTKVIQEIDNMEAGFVWIYLLSLPPTWKVVKEHLKSHFGIGKEKLKKIFAYLNAHRLIEYKQVQNELGQFGAFDIHVLNGSRFVRDLHADEPVLTDSPENRPPDEPATGEPPTIKEIQNTKEIKNQKENILCSSDDELDGFDQFWNIYPRKQKKEEAKKIWKRHRLNKIEVLICNHLHQRLRTEWYGREKGFIPLPTTFLNGRQWEDELISPVKESRTESGMERAVRMCLN